MSERYQRLGMAGAAAVILLVALAAGMVAYYWSFATGIADLQAKAEHQLDLYASNLEHEIGKYAYVPSILGLEPDVRALLAHHDDPALAERVNRFLERLNSRIDTNMIYVLDSRGKVVAASNWQHKDSFVGHDFSFRPYFQEALQGRPGRFYGIGTTSGEPGYYLSYGIANEDQWLGVTVAKISLDRLEQTWSAWEAPILVTDEEDIVILSSVPAWKFTSLAPLPPEKQAEFQRNHRYNQRDLPVLKLRWGARVGENSQFVRWTTASQWDGWPDSSESRFLAQTRRIAGSPWRLTVLASTRPARQLAFSQAALAGVLSAFLLLLFMANVRQRYIRERLAAREALQRANDELEERVAVQTAELSATVARLQSEVAERRRAEKTLREAQDGLVQAGKLAVIEDDPTVRLGCEQALQLEGIPTLGFDSAEKARTAIGAGFPGVVLSDIRLPGKDGMTLLRELRALDPDLPVVLITGHGDIAMAVQAMKDGAYDFMEKPFSPEKLVEVIQRALEKRRLTLEVQALRRQLHNVNSLQSRIIGRSAAIEQLRLLVADVAGTNADVLILGETGTGKELVARCLHDFSDRHARNFVALNCGGLPETVFESELFGHEAGAFTSANKRRIGKIEHANGGTLFLDEIESMPISLQIKLLRVLQERTTERLGSNTLIPIDCRVIAATKADLKSLSPHGDFRADLYYRLNVVIIELPPLRDRREDIPLLFEHFIQQAATRYGREAPPLEAGIVRQLLAYHWPGNIRELHNVADRYVLGLRHNLVGNEAAAEKGVPLPKAVEAFERALIAEALRQQGGNLTRAADLLQIAKTTLHDKMRKYGLTGELGRQAT